MQINILLYFLSIPTTMFYVFDFFLPHLFQKFVSFPLLALTQIRAFSGVTTKRQSPSSLMSHAKIIYYAYGQSGASCVKN